jgi:hypothetical protein
LADILVAVALLLLPLALLGWLAASWLFGTRARRSSSVAMAPIAHMVSTVGAAVVATSITRALGVVATSVAVQVGTIAHIAVRTCGYVAARFRGLDDSVVYRLPSSAGRAVHGVALNGSYELRVSYQLQPPESYRGATVDPAALPGPVRVGVIVEGEGLSVSKGGACTFEVGPSSSVSETFLVRPTTAGKTSLRMDFYHKNAWVQTLDIAMDVKPAPEAEMQARGPIETPGGVVGAVAEKVECSNTLPSVAPTQEARDLHLSLTFAPGEGHTYRARASEGPSAGVWRELNVPCREADLAEINEGLRDALDDLRRCFGDRLELPADEAASPGYLGVIDRLARRGNDAFHRLFPSEEDRAYLRRALSHKEHPNLEIATEAFFLPWELLYDSYDPQSVNVERFWGFRYDISRVLTDVRQKESPLLRLSALPRIAVFANPELPCVVERELPYFRALDQDGRISLCDWLDTARPEDDPASLQAQRAALFEYCRDHESDIAHFACHAVVEKYSRDSYIALSGQLRIRLEDMTVEKYHLAGCPFVVLNACGSGIRDPSKTSDFVRSLMMSGARGVLATECDVPDLFASVFIQSVYRIVLEGKSIVHSVLVARRDFLAASNNPLGLIYSSYLPIEARLVQGNGGG